MIILGLTGSIAMGKTTVAKQFAECGVAVCDSDKIVHALLGRRGEAVEKVAKLFPHALEGEIINRTLLGREVFGQKGKLAALEAILHPLVRKHQQIFIRRARGRKKNIVVLDIPLLFETHAEKRCDYVVVVTAPAFLQRQRVLQRMHMTPEKLASILARQMPDSRKRKLADFIVPTGMGKYYSLKAVRAILQSLKKPVSC
ncbi:MAG TPA: dephospho-CoA kinase [Rickettsiales bacterium]|nr:dephospho-CoA kinase [Rickettsiales bacterium]